MDELSSWLKEPLDSRQLLAFLHLSRTGSFTEAARGVNLSQSAVSHSIKALEEAVGCRLFDRLGKKAILTLAGEQMLHHTERIFREMSAAREALAHLGKWGKGRLRIGATTTACQYILPSVLREFKEPYPDYQIRIQPGDTPVVLDALRRYQIDVALALEPEPASWPRGSPGRNCETRRWSLYRSDAASSTGGGPFCNSKGAVPASPRKPSSACAGP